MFSQSEIKILNYTTKFANKTTLEQSPPTQNFQMFSNIYNTISGTKPENIQNSKLGQRYGRGQSIQTKSSATEPKVREKYGSSEGQSIWNYLPQSLTNLPQNLAGLQNATGLSSVHSLQNVTSMGYNVLQQKMAPINRKWWFTVPIVPQFEKVVHPILFGSFPIKQHLVELKNLEVTRVISILPENCGFGMLSA